MKDAEKEKFLAILEAHKKILYKISNAYCKDAANRKDLVQEMILQLWRSFPKYDSQYQLSTWIYRIALNVSISFYRNEHKRKQLTVTDSQALVNIKMDEPDYEKDSNIARLYEFINELNELDKALMILYLDGKKQEEIGNVLGISKSNVGTKIGRIKQQLKIYFSRFTQQNT